MNKITDSCRNSLEIFYGGVRTTLKSASGLWTAIYHDGDATVKFLKVSRYAILVLRDRIGEFPGNSMLRRDLKATINLLEGLQFIGVISSFLPVKKGAGDGAEEPEPPLLERLANRGFQVSDCISGSIYLVSKGVPLFGALSESAKLIKILDIASCSAALGASVADGVAAARTIKNYRNLKVSESKVALYRLAERVSGAVSLILILAEVGGTLASVATGFAALSAFFGLLRFAYNNNEKRGETWDQYAIA